MAEEFQLPLLAAVGDPAKVCSACRQGNHDSCYGPCADCGESYHPDGDPVYIHDRRAERAELDAMAWRDDL